MSNPQARPSMPHGYRDPHVATNLRVATYLHGAGTGDAGMQITLADDSYPTGQVMCVRLPGPTAERWLTDALAALRAARAQARIEPWGPEDDGV